jgi:hypothetical protein
MPLSYDASSLIKCQVSFNYLRYIVNQVPAPQPSDSGNNSTPQLDRIFDQSITDQATFNADAFTNAPDLGLDFGIETDSTNFFTDAPTLPPFRIPQ